MLEKKGYITRIRNKSRGIKLNTTQRAGLPIAGTIAAGQPLEINLDPQQETLDLAAQTCGYVLRVQGDSMIDDHIANGDLVLVDPDADVRDGDIVVAVCLTANGEAGAATLKRIYRERDRVRLQPANSTMEPHLHQPRASGSANGRSRARSSPSIGSANVCSHFRLLPLRNHPTAQNLPG